MSICGIHIRDTSLLTTSRFVHQHDEEYEEVKKTRRPGRPASTREDLLKMKITALEKEQRDGFCRLSRFPRATHVD
jgi:hypothetical protein